MLFSGDRLAQRVSGGYTKFDRRVRRVNRRARAWHVVVAGLAVLAILADVVWLVFRPTTALCSGPRTPKHALTVTPLEGPAAEELASDFAPIFVFSSNERFRPISADRFVPVTNLYRKPKGLGAVLVKGFDHTLAEVPTQGCGTGCHLYLDIQNGKGRSYRQIEAELADAPEVIAYRVLRYAAAPPDDTAQFTVQYWLLYLYNRLAGDNHEGDLEQVTVQTDTTPTPEDVFYSAHVAGTVRQWDDVESQGTHPIGYVAVGSHANYFGTGVEATVAHCPRRRGEEDVKCNAFGSIAADHANGCGDVWAPPGVDATGMLASTSCATQGASARRLVTYTLERWAARSVDWGHPKKNIRLGTDWVADPSIRGTWSDAISDMRANACYTIEEPRSLVP